ncbi:hypothetical protein AALA44_04910 [Enterococcus ratti]|uniref:hypothetical protein n=1 Tax=Enterococcus ratti TaxID=150033 RepID=UPI003512D22F
MQNHYVEDPTFKRKGGETSKSKEKAPAPLPRNTHSMNRAPAVLPRRTMDSIKSQSYNSYTNTSSYKGQYQFYSDR